MFRLSSKSAYPRKTKWLVDAVITNSCLRGIKNDFNILLFTSRKEVHFHFFESI